MTWAALLGAPSVDFEDLRMRIQAASASDAATPAERYRRDALAAAGSQARLDADPIYQRFATPPSSSFGLPSVGGAHGRADGWGLLRALVCCAICSRLLPERAAALLLAGQIKATATDLRCGVRPRFPGPFREMHHGYENWVPDLRALVVSRSGRRRRHVTDEDELAAPRLFARSATWSAEARATVPVALGRGRQVLHEHVATADLGVLCAKDEDAHTAPGDAFFGRVAHRRRRLPEAWSGVLSRRGLRRGGREAGAGRAGGGAPRLPRPVGVRQMGLRRHYAPTLSSSQSDRAPGRVLFAPRAIRPEVTRASGATRGVARGARARTRRTLL